MTLVRSTAGIFSIMHPFKDIDDLIIHVDCADSVWGLDEIQGYRGFVELHDGTESWGVINGQRFMPDDLWDFMTVEEKLESQVP